jgi:hypothetical protein
MYEHDEPSKEFSMVDLGSKDEDEDWDAPDTSRDEEVACKLFGDLNRDLLGPPSDGKVVVIVSDTDEEEHEDDHANTDAAPSSLRVPPAPSASAINDDGTPDRANDDTSGDRSKDEVDTP